MAEVFKAKSYGVEGFEKVIAIKRILPSMGEDRDFIKMFIDEAKIVGQLAHANICQIFELGRIDGAHFIAMEYIWGRDLLQLHNRARKKQQVISVPMACYIVAKVCEGLDYAHKKRDPMGVPIEIVHRDCSPQNILISYEGEVKIIDFGIAKAKSRSSRTMAGVLKGKFGYMSPEQVRGLPLDRRSDLFSLGTILYESLTGGRLFQGESDFSTLEKVRNVDIQPPSLLNGNIPPEVEAIVMKALEPDVDKRYQWCSEMQADLQKYLMTQEEVFTAKTLASFMKESFTAELSRERKLMEQYKKIGRDGLIAGAPQAKAKVDLVKELGEAGDPDGDPTMLGGPNFEELLGADGMPDPEAVAAALAADRAATALGASEDDGSDFAEEAPTEIYGDIDADNIIPAIEEAQSRSNDLSAAKTMLDSDPNQLGESTEDSIDNARTLMRSSPIPGLMAARQAAAGASNGANAGGGALAAAGANAPHPSGGAPYAAQYQASYPNAGYGGQPSGPVPFPGQVAYPTPGGSRVPGGGYGDQQFYGHTSSVPPLPQPGAGSAQKETKRRSSIVKDIAIGVVIAAVVLGLIAAGNYFFFSDRSQTAATGSLMISAAGASGPVDVILGGQKVGVINNNAPLDISELAFGVGHKVKVARDGFKPCEYDVSLSEQNNKEALHCQLEALPPPTGQLVLEGLTAEHDIFIDDQKVPDENEGKPLVLPASQPKKIVVKRGEKIVRELTIELAAGDEQRVSVVSPGSGESGDGGEPGAKSPPPETSKDEKADEKSDKRSKEDKPKKRKKQNKDKRKDDEKKPEAKEPAVEQEGYLVASSNPWARVYVDGKDTGKTTPIPKTRPLKLKPGKHKVTFAVGRQRFDYTVTIRAGETSRLSKDLPVD